jgi:peroxiredoxin Q/BCP
LRTTAVTGVQLMAIDGQKVAEPNSTKPRDMSTRIFLGFLGFIAAIYAVVLVYHTTTPPDVAAENSGLLEQCRQICMQYGLVSTGHIRNDAEAYLHAAQKRRLTEGLSVVLAESTFIPEASQPNLLLEKTAPNFSLPDVNGVPRELRQLGKDRPIVVVFYLGYGCSHCVAQLLALDQDQHYFRELDADIVAISSDASDHTAEKYKEYGEFHFPVLADVDYAVSTQWGVYQPETDDKPEFMKHGTYVVDRSGKVIWAAVGNEPFLDNKTLLHVLAKSQGLLPE